MGPPINSQRQRPVWAVRAILSVMLLAAGGCGPSAATDSVSAPQTGAGPGPEGTDAPLEAAASYDGATVSLVVPFGPGGSYDTYARFIAPALEEELGADVIVQNEPGAGSLLAMNTMITREPDGLTMAFMDGVGTGGSVIAEAEGVNFQLSDFSYVGRVVESPYLLYAAADGPYQTFEDVLDAEGFRFGATGVGAADYVTTSVLIEVLGLDADIVSGFEGQSEVRLGVAAGDMDALISPADSGIQAVESGEFVPLLVIGREPIDRLPGTPTILDLDVDLDEASRAALEAHLRLLDFGRPVIAPPNTPDDLLAVLRDALQQALEEPGVVASAEEQGAPISYLSGAELDDIAAEIESIPSPEYQEVLKSAYGG